MPKYTLINNNDANVREELTENDALEAALEALERLGYSLSESLNDEDLEDENAEAEYSKDCKNGLYPDKEDIAN